MHKGCYVNNNKPSTMKLSSVVLGYKKERRMPDIKYINASDAYKEAVKRGIAVSYPTLVKWLMRDKVGIRPFGKGIYIIDKVEFEVWLNKLIAKESKHER